MPDTGEPLLHLTTKEYQGVPDMFRYTHSDGHVSKGECRSQWLKAVEDYARLNSMPVPSQAECEHQLCLLLPPGYCRYPDGSKPDWFIDTRLSADDMEKATRVLMSTKGLVDKEEAERRGAICAACPFRVPITGCSSCKILADVVNWLGGFKKTKSDAQLEGKSCAVCKCVARAQIWIPIEALAEGADAEQLARYPNFCWKGNGIKALHASQNSDNPL